MLLLIISAVIFALFQPSVLASSIDESIEIYNFFEIPKEAGIIENEFVFPLYQFQIPKQYQHIFNDTTELWERLEFLSVKNEFQLKQGNYEMKALFAIPLNESKLVHSISFIPQNINQWEEEEEGHIQNLKFFLKNGQKSSEWNFEGTKNNNSNNIEIFTNGTVAFNGGSSDFQIPLNFTRGNYVFIPFLLSWKHPKTSYSLKMGSGIKLAFYKGQYENPPKKLEEILPSLVPTSQSSMKDTKSPHISEHDYFTYYYSGYFVFPNYDLLIIIAILSILLLLCLFLNIFLFCSSKKNPSNNNSA